MSDQFLGEIRIFPFGRAPRGWALCTGDLIPITQNQPLFELLGETFGGTSEPPTFALPDLRGRAPIHSSRSSEIGIEVGEEAHTLSIGEIASHNHLVTASVSNADQPLPTILAAVNNAYGPPVSTMPLRAATVSITGGGQSHPNMQPSITLSFCLALTGLPPSNS